MGFKLNGRIECRNGMNLNETKWGGMRGTGRSFGAREDCRNFDGMNDTPMNDMPFSRLDVQGDGDSLLQVVSYSESMGYEGD